MDLRSTAKALIAKHGAEITATRNTHGGYDVDNGDVEGIIKTYTSKAVSMESMRSGNSEPYETGSLSLIVSPLAYSPEEGDVILWAGLDYIVKTVKPIAPAGIVQVYELTLQR